MASSSGLTVGEKSFGVESEDPDRGSNPRRINGRRRSKASGSDQATSQRKKKIPQRGMGVAELERLRMQEEPNPSPTHYFHNPFAPPEPVPVGAPVKFPLSGLHTFGVVHHHHPQLPSIRDSVCIPDLCGFCVKKKRANDMDFCWNKSIKDDVGSMNINIFKERMEERSGDLVMHQFFPMGKKKDNVKVRLELGLEASPAPAAVAAAGGDDDDVVVFKKINSIDLSLRL